MMTAVSTNTEAILLLTAPLIVGRGGSSAKLLSLGEYNRLARLLRDLQHEPSDLTQPGAGELIDKCRDVVEGERLKQLLGRGFLLGQAIERWQSKAIWVVSRADAEYPKRLRARLKDAAPPILYGCGDAEILETGGLAIVGSRHVDDALVEYTKGVGRLAAQTQVTVVSGGARGIDQAAMRGALEAGGRVAGVLSDSLERTVTVREHRDFLMEGRLALASPYDPAAGFDVGNAMSRNKLIYALADVALVVSADYQAGGTWAGATEQLQKLRLVPVYVRSNGDSGKGLEALRGMGASSWPNPENVETLTALLARAGLGTVSVRQGELPISVSEEPATGYRAVGVQSGVQLPDASLELSQLAPGDELFAKVKQLLQKMKEPKTVDQVAAELQVSKGQAKDWLNRLVSEGIVSKKQKPLRYVASSATQRGLFISPDQGK